MKITWMALASVPLLLANGALVQDARPGQGLTRVQPEDRDGDEAKFDAEKWKKKLAQDDLAAREGAFESLIGVARGSSAAREAIEQWSRDAHEPDLAWTSRLLLREIRRGRPAGGRVYGFSGDPLLRDFDLDGFEQRFEDLDSMFSDVRRQFDDMLRGAPRGGLLAPGPGGSKHESSQGFSLQVGPDGAKCEITEDVDGKQEKKTYEAKTLDELLEAHPELRDRIHTAPRFRTFAWPNAQEPLMRLGPGGGASEDSGSHATEDGVRTDRLGVVCAPTPADKAKELGLEAGEGLLVNQVVDGTLADLLAIREGDVIVEVAGRQVKDREDVLSALADRAAGAELSVVVVDAKGARRTLTWAPKSSPEKDSKSKPRGKSF